MEEVRTASQVGIKEVGEVGEDLVYINRVKEGDVRAFDYLVKKYRGRLFAMLLNVVGNEEDAADLTQESLIKAFQGIGRFEEKSSFFTWLYRIGVNNAVSFIRKRKLRRFFSFSRKNEEGEEVEAEWDRSEDDVKGEVMKLELKEKLGEALNSLSTEHRMVVVLFEIEGLGHREIGEIMGCTEGTVRSRLHYAKQQLQEKLKGYIA